MGSVPAEEPEQESAKIAATRRHLLRRVGGFDVMLALRRALLVLLLADVAAAESQVSILAKTGKGANHVAATPSLVALMVLASLGVAVLLRWEDVVSGVQAAWQWMAHLPAAVRALPGTVQTIRAIPAQIPSRVARSLSLHHTLDRWRTTLRTLAPRHWFALTLAGTALLATILASALAGGPVRVLAAQWFWLAGMGLLTLAAIIWPTGDVSPLSRLRWRLATTATPSTLPRWRLLWDAWGDWLLLAGLLGVGLALRLPNLTTLPYVVHGDEASCAIQALLWLHGKVSTLLSTGWYGLPMLGYGIPALVMHFAGADLFGLRLSSVIVGVISLALLYLLAREFASRRVAFVATALMTVAHLHLQFSRDGIHYIHALCAVELALWLLVRALRTRSALAAVLSAITISICAQVYFSARIVFAIVPLFILGMLLLNRRLLSGRLPTLGWFTAGLVAALAPLAAYFTTNSGALNSRTDEVLILSPSSYLHDYLIQQFGTADVMQVLLRQLAAVPLLPTGMADQSTQYGPHYSLLDVGVATLVTIGFFYALLRLRHPLYLLLTIWISGVILLGGVVTIDMPDWQRLLVMLPALCLLAALVLEDLLRRVERSILALADRLPRVQLPGPAAVVTATLLALALVGLSANWNIQRYFVDYPHQINDDSWWTTYTDIGRYLGTLPAGTHFILFSDNDLIADYATLIYLGPGTSGTRALTTADLAKALAKAHGPTIVIVTPDHIMDVGDALSHVGALPQGYFGPEITPNHTTTFWVYHPDIFPDSAGG